MAKFAFTKRADQDFEDIAWYTAKIWGERQSLVYKRDLQRSVKTAAQFPDLGWRYISGSGIEFRRYNVGRHVLFYQQADEGILIVRVLHQSMDFDQHLSGRSARQILY